MSKLFLEYEEETMSSSSNFILEGLEIEEEFGGNDQDFEFEEQKNKETDGIMFMPLCLFREEIEDSIELDVEFNTKETDRATLVIVRYNEDNDLVTVIGRWYIDRIFKSRREALKYKSYIMDNLEPFKANSKIKDNKFSINTIDIITIPIED